MHQLGLLLLLVVFSQNSWAEYSIGQMAQSIFGPTEMLTRLLLIACYAVGAILVCMAMAQYKIHRQSPKLVPLTTPIMLLILGLICASIPYITQLFGDSFSAVEQAEAEGKHVKENVLPVPTVAPRGPVLPRSDNNTDQEKDGDFSGASEEGNNGHWTNDPHYY